MEPDLDEIALKRLQNEKDMLTKVTPPRGKDFVDTIRNILINYTKIKEDYINILLSDPNNIKLYENAFTSNSVNSFKDSETEKVLEDGNSTENNAIYKFYGDNIFENFMVWYLFRRFPSLRSANNVKMIARLKINYGPNKVFPIFANKYNFLEYTSSSLFERDRNENSLIQNVFSAFLGATSIIFDKECMVNGVGYSVCYEILKKFFNEDVDLKLPSKFEELDSPITTLKQFFDKNKYKIGIDLYGYECTQDRVNNVYNCDIKFKSSRSIDVVASGTAHLKKDAEKMAAINALQYLENKGYSLETKPKKKNFITNIIHGDRTYKFKQIIEKILNNANIQEKYKNILLTTESMNDFNLAFTSNTSNINSYGEQDTDSTENYEIYETLGDTIFKNFIGYYIIKRFNFTEFKYAKILSRIKINYGSNEYFATIVKNLGFLPFITASEDEHSTSRIDLSADVFESFLGAVAYILDNKIKIGVGYSICYSILENIFNKIEIPIDIEELKDPISILKEFFDKNKDFGNIEYICNRYGNLVQCNVYKSDGVNKNLLGSGTGSKNATAKRNAALNSVENLKKQGFKI